MAKDREKNMAAVVPTADMMIQKNSQILVNVEEALTDLLVVSYCTEDKKFQGVLLDSSKGNLPFGVYSLHPAFNKETESTDKKDEKLHSVSQRFTYQEPQYGDEDGQKTRKPGPKGKTQPRQKMTVRLRPRKVLCSNCQGICNENNENVDVSKKRKLDSNDDTPQNGSRPQKVEKKYLMSSMLIPKLTRLEESEMSTFKTSEGTVVKIPPLAGDYNEDSGVSCDMGKPDSKAVKKALKKAKKQAKKINISDKDEESNTTSPKHIGALSPHNNMSDNPMSDPLEKKHKHKIKHKKKRKVTKKRDENSSKSDDSIDYFSNIKEHCLKQKLSISLRRLSSNSYEKQTEQETDSEDLENETAPDFPANSIEGIGGKLLRVSPGDIVWGKVVGFPWWPGRVLSVQQTSRAHISWFASTTSSLMPCDNLCPFLEDYKICFNKKKKGAYKEAVKEATIEARRLESHMDPLASPTHGNLTTVYPTLRRLSSNSYEKQTEQETDSEDLENETAPDFPANSIEGIGGKLLRVSPGDIVWGKVVGFPWWPGRVLSVTQTSRAHVSWFASTTSSLMPCDNLCPFLEDYKICFNKKKKGAYKEAVKEATIEARRLESHMDPLASPTHTNLTTVSPRPIDVFS
ncbi:PWWP domain-containing protein 2A [Papilio machaon]|uniref:PWWP domain-containing protein 2A n=1 Tax=Papilio machaon TaxID=76193 RepID=A0A0N0PBA6_PAPMA|nr:PWWP domain-containing protein 2A [Papilio machaon]